MNTNTSQQPPEGVTVVMIDITPNWQGIAALYVRAAASGDKNFCGRQDAKSGIMQIARIADCMIEMKNRGLLSDEAKDFAIGFLQP